MEKKFQYFSVKDSDLFLQIHFHFHQLTPEIEQEIFGFLTTIYFSMQPNLKIDLKDLEYVDLKMITFLFNLGKELYLKEKHLILSNPPPSMVEYARTIQMDEIIIFRA